MSDETWAIYPSARESMERVAANEDATGYTILKGQGPRFIRHLNALEARARWAEEVARPALEEALTTLNMSGAWTGERTPVDWAAIQKNAKDEAIEVAYDALAAYPQVQE
jgi:hypothetical protein